jgi:hypothetical protein
MKSNLTKFLSVFTVEIVREFDYSNDVDCIFFFTLKMETGIYIGT